VSLKSWAGTCGYTLPTPLVEALGERESRPRRHRVAEGFAQFADPARRYAHLIDGGISDNLGLRAGIDMVSATGGLDAAARLMHQEVPRHVVVLSVNAETAPPSKFDLSSAAPGFAAMMAAVSGSQIRRYNFETLLLARESLERWVSEARGAGIDVEGHLIEVSFDNIRDPERRSRLKNLPTSFSLSDEEVDALRAAARELLLQSPDFQRLVAALEAG